MVGNLNKKNISNSNNGILYSTMIITLVSILAKFASFLSEASLASCLGTSIESDAFYMVSSIQQVIYPVLSVAIWKLFLPIYKKKLSELKYKECNLLSDQMITFGGLLSGGLFLFIYFNSVEIVNIVAPGFSVETKVICSNLVKISSPMYCFIIVSAIYASMLQCHGRFFGSQIREVVSHLPMIFIALIFYKSYGVTALAIALLIGSVCRLLIELPFVNWGYRYKISLNFANSDMCSIFKGLPFALLSEVVTQVNTFVDKVMASNLSIGSVASLNYGHKLTNVFNGLISSAVTTALYPKIIEMIALNKKNELSFLITKIIINFAIIMIPVSAFNYVYSTELVTLAFARGFFSYDSVLSTSGVFASYSLGLFFLGSNTCLVNILYAFGEVRKPLCINMICMLVNIAGNIILTKYIGVNGLAMASSLAAFCMFVLMIYTINSLININCYRMIKIILMILIITIGCVCVISNIVSRLNTPIILRLFMSSSLMLIIYIFLILQINIREVNDLKLFFLNKINKHI